MNNRQTQQVRSLARHLKNTSVNILSILEDLLHRSDRDLSRLSWGDVYVILTHNAGYGVLDHLERMVQTIEKSMNDTLIEDYKQPHLLADKQYPHQFGDIAIAGSSPFYISLYLAGKWLDETRVSDEVFQLNDKETRRLYGHELVTFYRVANPQTLLASYLKLPVLKDESAT